MKSSANCKLADFNFTVVGAKRTVPSSANMKHGDTVYFECEEDGMMFVPPSRASATCYGGKWTNNNKEFKCSGSLLPCLLLWN